MKTYYVYILKCSDQSLYTGITNNLDRRISEHEIGFSKKAYTYNRRPVILLAAYDFKEVSDAISFEKQVKGWSRAKKYAFINENFDEMNRLSKGKVIYPTPFD